MPRYRYISAIPDFELGRLIPGRPEVLNQNDEFTADLILSASIIEIVEEPIVSNPALERGWPRQDDQPAG